MPPLIFLAVIGAGCFAGYKLVTKMVEQAAAPNPREAERAASGTRDLGALEWDETAGVYKPRGNSRG